MVGSSGRCAGARRTVVVGDLRLALGLSAPAHVEADLVDALLGGELAGEVVGAVGDDRDGGHAARDATATPAASSPVSYISVTMSQPPTSSPLTNSCGIVGHLEIAESSWRMRGSGRMSTAAKRRLERLQHATVRAEKPQAGASGVPFMNRITSFSAIASRSPRGSGCASAARGGRAPRSSSGSARTGWLDMGAPGSRVWVVDGSASSGRALDRAADLIAEDVVDEAVLLDAAEALERLGGHRRAEVVAAAGLVLDLGAARPGSRPRCAALISSAEGICLA